MSRSRQFVTFLLRGQLFGLDIDEVQEVLRVQESTPVPLAPDFVVGLMNLRGMIVAVVDLRRRLSLGGSAAGAGEAMNVVVKTQAGLTSVLVDAIAEVVEAGEGEFEPVPSSVDERVRRFMKGVYRLEGGLLHVLDAEKAASSDEAS